jgi:hypothetical protein
MSTINFLLGPVWLVFLIVLHESSHAIAGKILGFRVFWIGIGYGRPLLDARLLGIRLKLNMIPFNGETALASPTMDWFRLRWWLVIFSGAQSLPRSDLGQSWERVCSLSHGNFEYAAGEVAGGRQHSS